MGDEGADFIWKNKGALAVSATLVAFVSDPQPFIDGVKQLGQTAADIVTENIVKPVVQSASKTFPWTFFWIASITTCLGYLTLRQALKLRGSGIEPA